MMRIAAADGGGALGTGARDCEGHASRGDGVNEGRFAGGFGCWVGTRFCPPCALSHLILLTPEAGSLIGPFYRRLEAKA